MRTVEINLYSFEELAKEVQTEVLEKYRDINTSHNWYESTVDEFKTNEKDFAATEVYFRGFSSQGDGAMFEYDSISKEFYHSVIDSLDLPQWKKKVLKKYTSISASGKHDGHYSHEKSVAHNILVDGDNGGENYDNIGYLISLVHQDIEEEIISRYERKAKELYRTLEKEYDFLTSDEQIIETFKANEYTFEATGNMRR